MPMVYVPNKSIELIEKIVKYLQKNTNLPSRVVKADVIHIALEEYAKKLGIKRE
jgi:hypothetical protein